MAFVIDGRSDIYSLGVILFELLTGRLPFDADSPWAIIHKHIYEQPPPLQPIRPDLTPYTYNVVSQCLQKEPANRFQTVQALTAALNTAIAAENNNPRVSRPAQAFVPTEIDMRPADSSSAPLSPPFSPQSPPTSLAPTTSPSAPTKKRRPVVWIAAAMLLILLAFAASMLWVLDRREAEQEAAAAAIAAAATETMLTVSAPSAVPTIEEEAASATPDDLTSTLTAEPLPTETAAPAPTVTEIPLDFPDGLIAYSCEVGPVNQIYLYDPVSGREFILPGNLTNRVVPAFSPDGAQISYRSNDSGAFQIYVANVDGSNFRQVTSGSGENREATWSPDGRQLAFVNGVSGAAQLYIINLDGSGQQRLTFDDVRSDDPSWSVHNEIIYERQNEAGRYDIYRIPAAGGTPTLLVDVGDSTSTPAWSPDGERLAFEVTEGRQRHIWLAARDGTGIEQVTTEGTLNHRPAWSPDGTRLVVGSNREVVTGGAFDIWMIDLQSKVMRRITSRGFCVDPAWGRPNAAVRLAVLTGGGSVPVPPPSSSGSATEWPVSETGVEACHLELGMLVTAGDNARLWSVPDVLAGSSLAAVPSGTSLTVLDGPVWGPVRLDIDASGWWWLVENLSGSESGWLWQARLRECPE